MTRKGRILPKEVIDLWPEVFEEVKLNVLPLQYLHSVLVNFKDGKCWEIKVTPDLKKGGWDSFEQNLAELIKTYEKSIVDIDFRLDVERVKTDIKKKTNKFLNKKTI